MSRGRLELAAYLVDHGADINATGANGVPALQNALFDPKTFDFLLARGANVNVRDSNGDSPLYHAVALNEMEAVKKLLRAGADVNSVDHRDEVPLHVAQDAVMARLLLAAGARVNVVDRSGFTPLMRAEWSVGRIELDRAERTKEESATSISRLRVPLGARGSDLDELQKLGVNGEMLAHRMNDVRTTEEKALATELKAAGGK